MMSKNQNHSDDMTVCVNGMDDKFYEYLRVFGEGYLMVSTYGVDMARRHVDLAGIALEGDDAVWWPELGVRMNKKVLSGVYAFADSPMKAPAIECDFDTVPAGLSFYFLPEYCEKALFNDITESYQVGKVPVSQLLNQRLKRMPVFNTCPCCVARAERILESVETHPVSLILEKLITVKEDVEFHLNTKHVSMIAQWKPQKISYVSGQINVVGGDYTLRLNATIVHTIRIFNRTKGKQQYTVMRCYNSFGELMIEVSVAGAHHEDMWNNICKSDTSNYSQMSQGAFLGE